MESYGFKVLQYGVVVAAVYSKDKQFAKGEIQRYANEYEQDGPIEVVEVIYESPEK